MSAHKDNHPLYGAIDAKLEEIAAAAPTPLPWYEAWAGLGPQSSLEERLVVYRAVRAAGSLPAEAGFFLVAWMADLLTSHRDAEGLREAEARLEAIRQKYGLEEGTPAEGEDVPAEYWEARQRCHDAWDALYAATLEEHGEQHMARLVTESPEEFEQQYEAVRQF